MKKKFGIIVILVVTIIICGIIIYSVALKGESNNKGSNSNNQLKDNTAELEETENSNDYNIQEEAEEFKNFVTAINGYKIQIYSTETEQPKTDAFFSTSFKYIDTDDNINNYDVEYVDIVLDEDEKNRIDLTNLESETINGKNIYYSYIDDSRWSAKLYYRLPDNKGTLIINLNGGSVYTQDGVGIKHLAIVNSEVLKSEELAKVLDFTITKE